MTRPPARRRYPSQPGPGVHRLLRGGKDAAVGVDVEDLMRIAYAEFLLM
jgi:hypothetical protein